MVLLDLRHYLNQNALSQIASHRLYMGKYVLHCMAADKQGTVMYHENQPWSWSTLERRALNISRSLCRPRTHKGHPIARPRGDVYGVVRECKVWLKSDTLSALSIYTWPRYIGNISHCFMDFLSFLMTKSWPRGKCWEISCWYPTCLSARSVPLIFIYIRFCSGVNRPLHAISILDHWNYH